MDIFKQISLSKFLNSSYIFEVSPETDGLYKYTAIIFVAFIVVAILISAKLKKQSKIYKKLNLRLMNLFMLTGIVGLGLIFFRFEGIPYLGSRFFMLVLLGVFILYLGSIYLYKLKVLPREIEKDAKQKVFERYLP